MIIPDPHEDPKNKDIKYCGSQRIETNNAEGRDEDYIYERDGEYFKQRKSIRDYGGQYSPSTGEKEVTWGSPRKISKSEYDNLRK